MNTQKSKKAVIRKELAHHSFWVVFLVMLGYIAILNLAHDASLAASGNSVVAMVIAALSVVWFITVVGIAQDWYNDAKGHILDSWDWPRNESLKYTRQERRNKVWKNGK